jgi:hypothetical protein
MTAFTTILYTSPLLVLPAVFRRETVSYRWQSLLSPPQKTYSAAAVGKRPEDLLSIILLLAAMAAATRLFFLTTILFAIAANYVFYSSLITFLFGHSRRHSHKL